MSGKYKPSIMDTEDGICYVCSFHGDTARHEVYPGATRKTSKENGFWVALCPRCHERAHKDAIVGDYLKRRCYETYLECHTKEEFYELIGEYYE